MEDGYKYSVRMEVVRPATSAGSYTINAWIYRSTQLTPGAGFSATQLSNFKKLSVPYTDSTPHVSWTDRLTEQQHMDFRRIFFGFTEATGGSYQQVRWEALDVFFPLAALQCTYSLDATSYTALKNGETGKTVTVTPSKSSCPWTAVSNDAWITVTNGSAGAGTGTVTYSVAANNTDSTRTGTMTIGGQTFTVTQPSNCTFTVTNLNTTFTNAGGHDDYTITRTGTSSSSCTWSTSDGGNTWITFTPTSGTATTSGTAARYDVAANTGIARSANITIAGQAVTVNQADGCSYSRAPANASPAAAGGAASFNVTAGSGCPWTAATTFSWLHTTSSGTGNGTAQTVNYTVDANAGPLRTGTITVAGLTFTVTQASGCTYSITPTSASYTAAANTGSVSVTAPAACSWTATESLSWVSITSGSSGSGNGTVNYSVDANPTSVARPAGTMTIAGQSFTINQAGVPCNFSIAPTSASYTAATGTGSVSVTAPTGCAWTASVTVGGAGITINSGSSGSGNGTVNYTVSSNYTTSPKAWTLTIAGAPFTVTQLGACTGYRVWNNYGDGRPFMVTGGTCTGSLNIGQEITNGTAQLINGRSITRYSSGATCGTARGSIAWADAVDHDTNSDCQVCYSAGDTVADCCPGISITTATALTGGTVNAVYSQQLAASGAATYEWLITGGALPAGLTLSSTGLISGTPTEGGHFNITVQATGDCSTGQTTTKALTLAIGKLNQTIAALSFSPATLLVGGTTTVSPATATSGLAVTFTSTTTGVCTVSGTTVTGVGAGTCNISANQAGNANYNAATQVTGSITVNCFVTVGGAIAGTTYTFTSSGTLVCGATSSVSGALVQAIGGGGGGGGRTTSGGAGGGGGGAFASQTGVTLTGTYTVTVGTGGASQTPGVSSSFIKGSTIVNAVGGGAGVANNVTGATGGQASACTPTANARNGGDGGNATGSNSGGGGGGAGSSSAGGNASDTTTAAGMGGTGTPSGGAGGAGRTVNNDGFNGNDYGGGGGGAYRTGGGGNRIGGTGGDGVVIISY